jgi:site-specific DNA recombinase
MLSGIYRFPHMENVVVGKLFPEALAQESSGSTPAPSGNLSRALDSLSQALGRPDMREKAADVICSLVSAIELTPENGDLAIVLRGDLAAMLSFASNKKEPRAPAREAKLSESLLSQALSVAGTRSTRWLRGSDRQGSLVAGVGFEPTTFRL